MENATDPEHNFFFGLTGDKMALKLCLSYAFAVSIILPIFVYSIIWYEQCGSDNRRTLINKFVILISYSGMQYLMFVQMPENIWYLYGPLPPNFCFFVRILRSALFVEMLIYLDLMIMTRYLYIFWIKNPTGTHDDFWVLFIFMLVKMLSFIFNGVWHWTISHQPLNFYICSGLDPTTAFQDPPR